MSYVVIARRYRPQQFNEIVGQEHITRTLSNAIANGRLGQAYIFSGPRGVGKTTTARILAMALNCPDGPSATPDISSPVCQAIIQGKSMDVMEIDGASNRRIEEVRNLRENINYTPSEGKYRIYIIDEVHMLTNEAFNALLKTLEEPPRHAVFIFATTEIHKVPATILSRCQRFDFRRIPLQTISGHLKNICEQENIEIEADAILQIAKKADGSMRDAQSILDQIISFSGSNVTLHHVNQAFGLIDPEMFFRFSDLIHAADLKGILQLAREVFTSGLDLNEVLMGLEEHLRNFLVARTMKSVELLDVSDALAKKYAGQLEQFSENDLVAYLNILTQALTDMKYAQQPYLKFELALVKMAKMPSSHNLETILEKLAVLKKKDLTSPEAEDGNENNRTEEQPVVHDIKYVRGQWSELEKKIHALKPTLANLLALIRLDRLEEKELFVEIECNSGQKNLIEKNLSLIESELARLAGVPLRIHATFKLVKREARKKVKNDQNRKELEEKFNTLRQEDPFFNKMVEELGLELE